MAQYNIAQQANLLSQVYLVNEASAGQWTALSNSGFRYNNWVANQTLSDIAYSRTKVSTLSGNSGFSVGLVQLDFASNNSNAHALADTIKLQLVLNGTMTTTQAASLYDALTNFHARNLDGFGSAKDYLNSNYDASIATLAKERFDLISSNRGLIESLLTTDPVVRQAFENSNLSQISDGVVGAQSVISQLKVANNNGLVVTEEDKVTLLLADIYNQTGKLETTKQWLSANPNATWEELKAFSSTRKNGASRASSIDTILTKVANGLISPDNSVLNYTGSVGANINPSIFYNFNQSHTYEYTATSAGTDGSIKAGDSVSLTYNADGTFSSKVIYHADGTTESFDKSTDGVESYVLWNQGKIQTLISTNSSGVVVGSFVRNGQRYNADGTPVVDLASTGAIPSVIDPNTITQVSFPVDNQADAQVATTINTTDADYALCNPGSGSTWSDLLPITVNYYLPTGGVSDVISQLQAQGYTVNLTQDSVYAYKDDGSYIYTDASSIEVGGGSIPNLKFDKNALQVTRTQQQADGVFLVDTFAIDPTNPSISTQISTGPFAPGTF